jgi:hypothetical protein
VQNFGTLFSAFFEFWGRGEQEALPELSGIASEGLKWQIRLNVRVLVEGPQRASESFSGHGLI